MSLFCVVKAMSVVNCPAAEVFSMLCVGRKPRRFASLQTLITPKDEGGVADLTLKINKSTIPASRVMLMAMSPVFRALLEREPDADVVDLSVEMPCDIAVLSAFVSYCAIDCCDISSGYIWSLLAFAHASGVGALVQDCAETIIEAREFDAGDIWAVAEKAHSLGANTIVTHCAELLEKDPAIAMRELVAERMVVASGPTIAAVISRIGLCKPEIHYFELIMAWHAAKYGVNSPVETKYGHSSAKCDASTVAGGADENGECESKQDGTPSTDSSQRNTTTLTYTQSPKAGENDLKAALKGLRLSRFSSAEVKGVLKPSNLIDPSDLLDAVLFSTDATSFSAEERADVRFAVRKPKLVQFGSAADILLGYETAATGVTHNLDISNAFGCFLEHANYCMIAAVSRTRNEDSKTWTTSTVDVWYWMGDDHTRAKTRTISLPRDVSFSGMAASAGYVYVLHQKSRRVSRFSPVSMLLHGNAMVDALPACHGKFVEGCTPCIADGCLWAVATGPNNCATIMRYRIGSEEWENCGIPLPSDPVQLVGDPVREDVVWAVCASFGVMRIHAAHDGFVLQSTCPTECANSWHETRITAAFAVRSSHDSTIIGAYADPKWLFYDTSDEEVIFPSAEWDPSRFHIYNFVENRVWLASTISREFLALTVGRSEPDSESVTSGCEGDRIKTATKSESSALESDHDEEDDDDE